MPETWSMVDSEVAARVSTPTIRSTIFAGAALVTTGPLADRTRNASLKACASQCAFVPPDNSLTIVAHSRCQMRIPSDVRRSLGSAVNLV